MNDHDLDRLVASATPVRDAWLDGLDLRDAENELMEEIMATQDTPAATSSGPLTTAPPPLDHMLHAPRGPHKPRRPRRSRLVVATGLVAAALIGAVAVRSIVGNGDDDGAVHAGSTPPISPMIADPLPDGFAVNFVDPEEGPDPNPASVPSSGPANTLVYGDVTATAVTDDIVIRTAPSEPDGDVLGEDVPVRGAQGTLCSPGPNQCDFGNNVTGVSWTEGPGLYVSVESRSYDREHVLAIAEGLVVDDGTIELGDLPAGVSRPPKVAELDDRWGWAYHVQYATADVQSSFAVSTRVETEAMRIYDLWLSGPRTDTVQGRPAAFEDIDGSYVLTWEPVPGQLVEVMAGVDDEAAARAFAETVRPATDAEWADVQEQAGSAPGLDSPAATEPPPDAVHRTLADGSTEVWGWRNDDGDLCYQVGDDGGMSSLLCSVEPGTGALGVSPANEDGELSWDTPAAVGVAPDGTESIDGGEVTIGEQVDGGRLFVWEFANGEMPQSLTFRGVGGNELGTADVVVI